MYYQKYCILNTRASLCVASLQLTRKSPWLRPLTVRPPTTNDQRRHLCRCWNKMHQWKNCNRAAKRVEQLYTLQRTNPYNGCTHLSEHQSVNFVPFSLLSVGIIVTIPLSPVRSRCLSLCRSFQKCWTKRASAVSFDWNRNSRKSFKPSVKVEVDHLSGWYWCCYHSYI